MAGTYFQAVYLNNYRGQNPFTVAPSGLVSVTSGDAIVGTAGYASTVLSQGTIKSSFTNYGTIRGGAHGAGTAVAFGGGRQAVVPRMHRNDDSILANLVLFQSDGPDGSSP